MKISSILGFFLAWLLGSYKKALLKLKYVFLKIEEDYSLIHKSIFQIGLFQNFWFCEGKTGNEKRTWCSVLKQLVLVVVEVYSFRSLRSCVG